MSPPRIFADRRDAGRRLADALRARGLHDPVVLALPRGGVPVGYEVASALACPLDILLVRKIGAPGHEELGIGAVVDGAVPHVVMNDDVVAMVRPPKAFVDAEVQRQLAEIERRRKAYLGDRGGVALEARTAVVVDDGIATGGTVKAALHAVRHAGAARVVLAVPVAAPDSLQTIRPLTDDLVCLLAPPGFTAVGRYYADFDQTDDREVIDLLERAAAREAGG